MFKKIALFLLVTSFTLSTAAPSALAESHADGTAAGGTVAPGATTNQYDLKVGTFHPEIQGAAAVVWIGAAVSVGGWSIGMPTLVTAPLWLGSPSGDATFTTMPVAAALFGTGNTMSLIGLDVIGKVMRREGVQPQNGLRIAATILHGVGFLMPPLGFAASALGGNFTMVAGISLICAMVAQPLILGQLQVYKSQLLKMSWQAERPQQLPPRFAKIQVLPTIGPGGIGLMGTF